MVEEISVEGARLATASRTSSHGTRCRTGCRDGHRAPRARRGELLPSLVAGLGNAQARLSKRESSLRGLSEPQTAARGTACPPKKHHPLYPACRGRVGAVRGSASRARIPVRFTRSLDIHNGSRNRPIYHRYEHRVLA